MTPVQDGTSGPGLRVLTVCKANICRSALAAFVLGQSAGLSVFSAGVDARAGSAMCLAAAERISGIPGGEEYASMFRSRTIEWNGIEDVDLVLTATGELRGQLLASQPLLLRRTFTMLEALALMAEPLDGAEVEQAQQQGIAAVLFGRRGTIASPPALDRRWKGRHDGFDVPDGHQFRRKSHHQATVEEAVRAAKKLRQQLTLWQRAVAGARFPGRQSE